MVICVTYSPSSSTLLYRHDKIKNAVAIEIWAVPFTDINEQPFKLSHILDPATSQVTRPFSKIICFTRRAFAAILDLLDRAVLSSWMVDHFRTLHHFLTCCTVHVISGGSEFLWWKVSPIKSYLDHKLLRGTMFPVSLAQHINLSPEQHLTDSAICYTLPLLQVLVPTERWSVS
jgi:hypothetical protein